MGSSLKFTAISTALLFALSSSVFAGDYYPPGPVDDAPEVTVVEFGTGWYLRGDIAYSDTVDPGFTFGGVANGQDLGNGQSFSVGAGYMVNNYLRIEGTVDYTNGLGFRDERTVGCGVWNTPVAITGQCSQVSNLDVETTSVSLNGYLDLGNFRGFTPYVGGGIGVTHLDWGDYSFTNRCQANAAGDCQIPSGTQSTFTTLSDTAWSASGSLMAGFAYDLTKNLKLDIGYKYTYITGGTVADDIPNGTTFSNLEYDAFDIHQVKVGLRYEIW